MNFYDKPSFTEVDYALEEAQFVTQKEKISHSIIQVNDSLGRRFYVVPTDTVVEVTIIETFSP